MFVLDFRIDKKVCFFQWLAGQANAGATKFETITLRHFKKRYPKGEKKAFSLFSGNWLFFDNLYYFFLKKTSLYKKFEKKWNDDYEKLKEWKVRLTKYNFSAVNNELKNISFFFGQNGAQFPNIDVFLCLSNPGWSATASINVNYEGIIVLDVSSVSEKFLERVVAVIAHELVHKFGDRSVEFEKLLCACYEMDIQPCEKETIGGYRWRDILIESVVYSISAWFMPNYIGNKIISLSDDELKKELAFDLELNKENGIELIRHVAQKMEKETTRYINEKKQIDEYYTKILANYWMEIIKKL